MPKGQGQKTVKSVMGKFKRGTLKSGSGHAVTSRKQAVAIGMKEGGISRYDLHEGHGCVPSKRRVR